MKVSELFLTDINVKGGEAVLACILKKEKSYFAKSSKLYNLLFCNVPRLHSVKVLIQDLIFIYKTTVTLYFGITSGL